MNTTPVKLELGDTVELEMQPGKFVVNKFKLLERSWENGEIVTRIIIELSSSETILAGAQGRVVNKK